MKFAEAVVSQLFGESADVEIKPVGGGCIHQAGQFLYAGKAYFLKWSKGASRMFETEAKGLELLRHTKTVHVPEVVGKGKADTVDFLCLTFEEQGQMREDFWTVFGRALASLHRHTAENFGLNHDNFIGSLPQINKQNTDWAEFFIQCRLMPQIRMARDRGLIDEGVVAQFDRLLGLLPGLLPEERPALLHGDLWSGNFLTGGKGQPVIFDPAVYYGHREAELAFTRMFGGFDNQFYESYHHVFPLQEDYQEREQLFNLYPLLVHVNLFGSSYLSGVVSTLRRFA